MATETEMDRSGVTGVPEANVVQLLAELAPTEAENFPNNQRQGRTQQSEAVIGDSQMSSWLQYTTIVAGVVSEY